MLQSAGRRRPSGKLEEGKDADIIVMKGKLGLDTDAMVYYTMIEGKIVYQK